MQITEEPLNLVALRDFASRRGADTTHLRGCAATLRECIYYFLQCVDKVPAARLGTINVLWREAASLENAPVRRFSGATHFLHDDEHKYHVLVQKVERLVSQGVPEAFVGKSAFAMPKLLRYLARTGLPACDIDQNSCHFLVQWSRHKCDAPLLNRYLGGERDQILADVASKITPSPDWPPDWTTKAVAKQLFIKVGYAGCAETWASRYGVRHSALPPFVAAFAKEQGRLRRLDAQRHPDLMELAKKEGHRRPDVAVQSALNMRGERAQLDAMEAALDTEKDQTGSYEHDGLFVWRLPTLAHEGWERELLARIPRRIKVGLKAIPSSDQLWQQLRKANPKGEWENIDADWEAQMDHVMAARPGAQLGKEDRLYAQVVALEGACYDDYTYPVKALFKHAGGGNYWHFDRRTKRWESDTEAGKNELLHVISCVLVRRLSDYRWEFDEEGDEVLRHEPSGRGTILNNSHLAAGVERLFFNPTHGSKNQDFIVL